jgi:hypothetical protein
LGFFPHFPHRGVLGRLAGLDLAPEERPRRGLVGATADEHVLVGHDHGNHDQSASAGHHHLGPRRRRSGPAAGAPFELPPP